MIKVERNAEYLIITVLTNYFGYEYRVMAPITKPEAEELAHAIQVELQEIFAEKNGEERVAGVCICVPPLPIMAGCPVHDNLCPVCDGGPANGNRCTCPIGG